MKKKIIFVTQALWIGGIESALVNLLQALDHEKYEITCLILRDDQTMAPRLPEQCRLIVADRDHAVTFQEPYKYARLFHLTEEPKNPSALHRAMMFLVPVIRWIENRLYIRYIRKAMAAEHFDSCVIYSDVAAETAVRAINADKFLMFYHHGAMRKVYHDEIGYRKSEKIIAVSRNVEKELRRFRPAYADKMMTIHNLTDTEDIRRKSEAPVPETFCKDEFNIVSCGRVSPEKGMDLAVEACAKLVEDGHDNIHWWIVGGGPAEGEVREKIRQLHMEDHVTMLGMKRNPYPYMKMADLYVQPSRVEGYPMTILEALILGKPVVATNTDGAREILQDGVTGLLCQADEQKIGETITRLVTEQPLRQYLEKNTVAINHGDKNCKRISKLEVLLDS